jgi:uncharacterized protein GlcG (DUF336 family)
MRISAPQHVVHWEAAVAATSAAARAAEAAGIRINVAVVDAGGNLAAFVRMPLFSGHFSAFPLIGNSQF